MVTIWTLQAIAELRKAYGYISKDSPQNARNVVDEIIGIADQLPDQLEMSGFLNDKLIQDELVTVMYSRV
jgi:plasmid stabilization system protein ParE